MSKVIELKKFLRKGEKLFQLNRKLLTDQVIGKKKYILDMIKCYFCHFRFIIKKILSSYNDINNKIKVYFL